MITNNEFVVRYILVLTIHYLHRWYSI